MSHRIKAKYSILLLYRTFNAIIQNIAVFYDVLIFIMISLNWSCEAGKENIEQNINLLAGKGRKFFDWRSLLERKGSDNG